MEVENSWLLSTPMLRNTNTPILEIQETKTQRELFIVIDEMANILEHFWKVRTTKRRQLQQN